MIVAMSENRVIGKDNALPWSIKGNLAHFKNMTMGWPCIMGRKTWESLPKKPLPGRLNIIVSGTITQNSEITSSLNSSAISRTEGSTPLREIIILSSLSSAIEYCADYEKIFICGGESIYKQAMPLATKIDLSLIPGQYDGDTFFPEIDASWIKSDTTSFDNFSVITYIRANKE